MSGKVLIVDDEPDIQGMINLKMRKHIRSGKLNFVFATNGQEALDRLRQDNDIDVIVSDINMPVMDGLTLISKTKTDFPDLKAIMVTAYGDMDNIRSAMKNGVQDYLVKPINFDDFEFTLNRTLKLVQEEKKIRRSRRKAEEELKKAKERLSEAYEKEKRLNLLKSNFISMVSREYRNPLSIIQSSTDVLKTICSKSNNGDCVRFLNHIELSVKAMSEILDDVLSYEEIEKKEISEESQVCISCLLTTIIFEFERMSKRSNKINLTRNSESIKINADENLLYMIFINLLSNASKFSQPGSEIDVNIEDSNDYVIVRIKDRGCGIPNDELDAVFEPFQRCSNVRKIPGTGLGLSIVKKGLEKLGGSISLESVLSKGTTVSIKLNKKEACNV